jgi:hypothetical protein
MSVVARGDHPVPLGPDDGSIKTDLPRKASGIMRRFVRSHDPTDAGSDALLRLVTNSLPVLISYVDAGECYRFANDTYQAWHWSASA